MIFGYLFRAFLVLLLLGSPLARAELVTTPLSKVNDLTKAELCHETTFAPNNGVLVLLPGMNGDGKVLVSENSWRDFAKTHGVGLVGVTFSSPPSLLYGNPAKGYYYPEQGSGAALLNGLSKIYGKDVKILLYGFSGGAQFGSRFAELYPEKMLGWAAYSASFWKAPSSAGPNSSPGVIACGEFDAQRYGPSFAYFQQGRRKDARWTWVSIGNVGHMRHKRFEEFIRAYFASVLDGKFDHAQWLDAETKLPTTEDDRLLNPALSVWLPTSAIADSWLKLHHP
jgi:pimeloyl-ACP methyl ester carboxylesterase